MPRRINRAVTETALETALFGVAWDARACEQRLAAMAGCTHDDPQRSHHLLCAISALQGARASLASAERFAAQIAKGGAS